MSTGDYPPGCTQRHVDEAAPEDGVRIGFPCSLGFHRRGEVRGDCLDGCDCPCHGPEEPDDG